MYLLELVVPARQSTWAGNSSGTQCSRMNFLPLLIWDSGREGDCTCLVSHSRRPVALTSVLVLLSQKGVIQLDSLLKKILLLYRYKEVLCYM